MDKQKIYTKEEIKIERLLSTRIKNLTGKTFGKWHVIGYAGNNKDHKSLWWCMCECNQEKFYKIVGSELSRSKTQSCGCGIIESNKQRGFIEAVANSFGLTSESYKRICRIYKNMCRRCYDTKSKDYPNYGEKGINVCKEWLADKTNFIQWCVDNGYNDTLTIERIDVNDGYNPSNCTWVTHFQQASNKTTTKYIDYQGKTLKLIDFLRDIGCSTHKEQNKVRCRLFRYGWSVEDAIKEYV